ncbi:MAG: glutathione peroxidase [Xanthomonadales bacterium]|nr:glutathione peroxidase [Xanthomonadales bacterium]
MKTLLPLLILLTGSATAESNLLDHDFRKLAAKETVNLGATYGGQVLLVVNTASKCGNTPQYDGLEALYDEYKDRGFAVLGFPSNDFMGQEPGTEEEIQDFCRLTYGVQFPMFAKTSVRDDQAHPFYRQLREISGEAPSWNFHKYLIGRDGQLIASFKARTEPYAPEIIEAIEAALAAQG